MSQTCEEVKKIKNNKTKKRKTAGKEEQNEALLF